MPAVPQVPPGSQVQAPGPSPPGAWGPVVSNDALGHRHEALVLSFCAAVLGEPAMAHAAAREALDDALSPARADPVVASSASRVDVLRAGWRACRQRTESHRLGGAPDRPPMARSDSDAQTSNVEPGGEPPVLGRSGDLAGDVLAAASRLRMHERAALALRGLPDVAPAEAAEVLELDGEDALDRLVGQAQLALGAQLRSVQLPALDADPVDCAAALGLIGRRPDLGIASRQDREWLDAHLAQCPRCPQRRRVMREAALAWRACPVTEPDSTLVTEVSETVAGDRSRRRPPVADLRREIRQRGMAVLAGGTLIATGAIALAPESARRTGGPSTVRRALSSTVRASRPRPGKRGYGRARVTWVRVHLPTAPPSR